MKLLFMILFCNLAFTQCDYDIGDINQDGNLNVVDIIEMVNFVLSTNTYDSIYDLNFNNVIDIVDIIVLINRVLSDQPQSSNVLAVDYNFQNLSLIWESSSDEGFIITGVSLFWAILFFEKSLIDILTFYTFSTLVHA